MGLNIQLKPCENSPNMCHSVLRKCLQGFGEAGILLSIVFRMNPGPILPFIHTYPWEQSGLSMKLTTCLHFLHLLCQAIIYHINKKLYKDSRTFYMYFVQQDFISLY